MSTSVARCSGSATTERNEAGGLGVVEADELLRRADDLPLPDDRREEIARLLRALVAEIN